MTRTEYERQKRELEECLSAAIELLQIGYEAQLRALELAWSSVDEAGEHQVEEGAQAALETAQEPPRAAGSPPKSLGELVERVRAALARLPEEIRKSDIVGALGFSPQRSSLHRALDKLIAEGAMEYQSVGLGRRSNVYRNHVRP